MKSARAEEDYADAALIAELCAGDPSAIDRLYRAHQHGLRAFARRLVGEEQAAEDLVHDVFVRVPVLMRRYRGPSSVGSFLLGITANLASRHVRSASRRRAALVRHAQEFAPGPPDHEHEMRERVRSLYRALDALPLRQRMAFVLCELEERSAAEVAEILDIPQATVRTRCFHARKTLSQRLGRAHSKEQP